MKAYWDSAALIEACSDVVLRTRLRSERGVTRTHALAEVFSTLTGNKIGMRFAADAAAQAIDSLAADLDFVDLNEEETRQALRFARQKGVRGGRVHDLLHAVAAEKAGVKELLTIDQNDFNGLMENVKIVQLE